MGRPKTPTQLKLVRGTQRKDRANPAEPTPKQAAPKDPPPTWLSKKARPWWRRIRPLLLRMQVLTEADPVALGLLCDALAEYIAARELVVKEGLTYTSVTESFDDDGERVRKTMKRAHPAVAIQSDAWRRAKLMLTEFGLTPASRSKVSTKELGPADPLEAWERGTGS